MVKKTLLSERVALFQKPAVSGVGNFPFPTSVNRSDCSKYLYFSDNRCTDSERDTVSTSYEAAQTASEISDSIPSDLAQNIECKHSKFLKVMSTNLDSLPNKLTELRILAAKNDYDVVCVAEITPKNTNNPLDDAHIGIAGYFLFTNLQDDPRRGK